MREAVARSCCIDAHKSSTSFNDCAGSAMGSLREYGGGELKDTLFVILIESVQAQKSSLLVEALTNTNALTEVLEKTWA